MDNNVTTLALPETTPAVFTHNVSTSYNATNGTAAILSQKGLAHHVIGMTLAISGNLLISVSLSVQKKAHNRLGHHSQAKYCMDKWWWTGMLLMVLGEMGNFMAYGFAPASLVAPLGSVAVLANAVIAVVFLREPLTTSSMMGVTLVLMGSLTLISFAAKTRPTLSSEQIMEYLKAWTFLLYIGIEAIVLIVLLFIKYVRKNEHLVILLLLVGIIASVTVIASKAISTMISESIFQGKLQIMNVVFWVCLVILPITTATQIRLLNRAMQLYDVSDVVPVNFMFFTVSAVLAGAIFYKEFQGVAFDRVFMFIFGCLLSFAGVYIISHQNDHKNKELEKQRAATGDSGLESASIKSDESTSIDSNDVNSITDVEDAPGSGKSSKSLPSQGGNSEHTHLIKRERSDKGKSIKDTSSSSSSVFKGLVEMLKKSKTIKNVQQKDSEIKP
ncbi:NIPA-like protein 2 [Ciona intestinalis]